MSYDRYQPHNKETNWPNPGDVSIYQLIPEIEKLGDNLIGCEIGVNFGTSLTYILDVVPNISKIYGIDPYFGMDGHVNLQDAKTAFLSNLNNGRQERIVFIEKFSDDAVTDIPDNELDYIFIDGLHTYDQLYKDCTNYWSKVKTGGLFSGHDWPMAELQNAVYRFMDELSIPRDKLKITNDNTIWYWTKE